jgi:hypothetical protein
VRHCKQTFDICTTKCQIAAHPTVPPTQRKIHSMDDFKDLTCFQIAHTKMGEKKYGSVLMMLEEFTCHK